ncbi:hypothetical protein BX600DRAFT_516720 [Xylariales sp. PMI_506]|nr:hypothetical protein BX600DRAFT_516720 [Xylariales sp. PMI_506]
MDSIFGIVGKVDNFDEPTPDWNYPSVFISSTVSILCISTACVIFRLYTRFRIIRSPGWDDLVVVLVLICNMIGTISACVSTQHGFGQHLLTLKPSNIMSFLKLLYTVNGCFSMSLALVKIALLLQYLRIFGPESPRTRLLCIFTVTLVSLWGVAYSFLAWFPCFPVEAYWNLTAGFPGTVCYAYGSIHPNEFYGTYLSNAVFNMVFDIVILVIPIQLYFEENASSKTKLGLLAVLLMGGIVNVLSIWKTISIVQHHATMYPTFDPTWYGPITILLGTLEVDTAIICASVPVFWPTLSSKLNAIFVTKEVTIHRMNRSSHFDEAFELGGRYRQQASLNHLSRSRTTSQSTLGLIESLEHDIGKDKHYRDKYILGQVDPLNNTTAVETEVTAKLGGGK